MVVVIFSESAKYREMQGQPDTPDGYAAIFDALAHPARRRILISLNFAGGTMSAGEIARLFGHAWPTTTRHLQVMTAAGLVSQERRGRVRAYRIESKRLAMARDWLGWFARDPVTGEETGDERDRAVQDQFGSRRA